MFRTRRNIYSWTAIVRLVIILEFGVNKSRRSLFGRHKVLKYWDPAVWRDVRSDVESGARGQHKSSFFFGFSKTSVRSFGTPIHNSDEIAVVKKKKPESTLKSGV